MLRPRNIFNLFRTISNVTRQKVHFSNKCEVDINKNYILEKECIEEAVKSAPILSSATLDLWHRAHDVFTNHGVNTKDFLQIVASYPTLLSRNPTQIVNSFEAWRSCQFGEKYLHQLITKYPALLDFNENHKILEKTTFIRNYVGSPKNVWKLLMCSPNLITEHNKTIGEKFEYLTKVMRLEPPEIVKSSVFAHSLEEIKCRHVFLVRLGIFKPRSPKAEPHEPSKNPKLYQIMDNSDKAFATSVAGVTLAEFEAFQELYKRELERAQDDEAEWSDDDIEQV